MKRKKSLFNIKDFDDMFSTIAALLVIIILWGGLAAIIFESEIVLYIVCSAFLIYLIMTVHTIITCGLDNSFNFINAGLLMVAFIVVGFIVIFMK